MLGDQQISGQLNKDGSLVRNKKGKKGGNEGGEKTEGNENARNQRQRQGQQKNDEQESNELESKPNKKGAEKWIKNFTLADPPGYPATYPVRMMEGPPEPEQHLLMSSQHIKRNEISKKKLDEIAQKIKFNPEENPYKKDMASYGEGPINENTAKRTQKYNKPFKFTKLDFE